jgi:hypothetical protein
MESYSLRQIEIATALVWVLGIVVVVAVIALLAKKRSLFLGGAIGSFLGFVVREPRTESICSSAEAAFLVAMNDYVSHIVAWGVLGAIMGLAFGTVAARGWFIVRYEPPTKDNRQSRATPDQPGG